MMQKDKILWQVLAITGLNFIRYRFGPCGNFFRKFFMFFFPLELIYIASLSLGLFRKKHFKEGTTLLLLPLFCALMWYFAYSRKKEISDVLVQIYNCIKKCKDSKISQCYIIPLLFIILVLPFIKCVIDQFVIDVEEETLSYWTFDYQIQNKFFRRMFLFHGSIIYLIFCLGFPFYLTFCLNILFYRCSQILSSYNTELAIQLLTKLNLNVDIFKVFFNMLKLLKKLNQEVVNLSFLIVFYSFGGIFVALLTVTIDSELQFNIAYKGFVILYFSLSITIFMSYVICSSLIPENLNKIKNVVKEFINEYGSYKFISKQNMFYLQRIESEETLFISACGVFNLSRSILFSALGSVLTYGLLIIGLKI